MTNVGAVITCNTTENYSKAGASIQQMYIYAPSEWHDDLDRLFDHIRDGERAKATVVMKKLNRLVSDELKKD